MKKFLTTFFILVLCLLGGLAFFFIRSFNAENYQQQVVQTVSELTGRTFSIRGNTSFKWFPLPTLVLSDVSLTNQTGSPRQMMMTAKTVSVQIEWESLFKTPLVVKSIHVEQPHFVLERLADNRSNWNFPFFSAQDDLIDKNMLMNTTTQMNQTKIDQLTIENGSVEYVNEITGISVMIEKINGDLSLDSLKGPYRFNGQGNLLKQTVFVAFDMKRLQNDTPIDFSLNLKEKQSGLNMDLTGAFTPDDRTRFMTADGSFSLNAPNTLLGALQLPTIHESLNKPSVGNLGLELTPLSDALKSITIRLGESDDAVALTGSLSRTLQGTQEVFNGGIALNQIDYALWVPFFDRFKDLVLTPSEDFKNKELTLKTAIQNLKIGSGTIKDVSANIVLSDNRFSVQNGKAVLPGKTSFSFSGQTGFVEKQKNLKLAVHLDTKDLRSLLTWSGLDVSHISDQFLKKATVKGSVIYTPESIFQLVLDQGVIDASSVSGSISASLKQRPSFVADLKAKNVNFDSYLGYKAPSQSIDIRELPNLLKQKLEKETRLNDFDSQIRLEITEATLLNLPIGKAGVLATLNKGILTFDKLQLQNMATASLSAAGSISGIGSHLKISDFALDFAAKQTSLFMQRAGLTSVWNWLNKAEEVYLTTRLNMVDNKWDIATQTTVSDFNARLNGTIVEGENQTLYQNLVLDVAHPNFQTALKLIYPQKKILPALDGSFKMKGTLNGAAQDFTLSDVSTSVGIQRLNGDIAFTDKGGQKLVAHLTTPSFDAGKFLPDGLFGFTGSPLDAQKPLDLSALATWDIDMKLNADQFLYQTIDLRNAACYLTVRDKILTLVDLSGEQRGETTSPFKVSGSLSFVQEPILKMAADIANIPLRSDFLLLNRMAFGNGFASLKLNASGHGKTPAEILNSLDGSGELVVNNAQWIGVDLSAVPLMIQSVIQNMDTQASFENQMKRLLNSGKTAIDTIMGKFSISEGIVRFLDMSLKAKGIYSNPMQLSWKIPSQALDVAMPISLEGLSHLPPFALLIKGTPSKKTYETNFTDLSMAIAQIVDQGTARQVRQQEQMTAQALQAAQQTRENQMKEAVQSANEAVRSVENRLMEVSNDKASYLLQNAKDAVTIMNEMAIKENLTDAQYIQIMEQSRLAVLKANEALKEIEKDIFFEDRKTLLVYEKQSQEMLSRMEQMYQVAPEIEIIGKLIPAVQKNIETIQKANQLMKQNVTQEQGEKIVAAAAEAYRKIEKAYLYVNRFDAQALQQQIQPTPQRSGFGGIIERRTDSY